LRGTRSHVGVLITPGRRIAWITGEQRLRFVELMSRAADDVGLR